jgi:hypothetical protein
LPSEFQVVAGSDLVRMGASQVRSKRSNLERSREVEQEFLPTKEDCFYT